eukprot:100506-Chlamydomonas_euryale.AAC.1
MQWPAQPVLQPCSLPAAPHLPHSCPPHACFPTQRPPDCCADADSAVRDRGDPPGARPRGGRLPDTSPGLPTHTAPAVHQAWHHAHRGR